MENTILNEEEDVLEPEPSPDQIALREKILTAIKPENWNNYIDFFGLENKDIELAASKDTSLKVLAICKEKNLNEDQTKKIAKAVGLIIIKKITAEKLITVFERELHISPSDARKIIGDIQEKIFNIPQQKNVSSDFKTPQNQTTPLQNINTQQNQAKMAENSQITPLSSLNTSKSISQINENPNKITENKPPENYSLNPIKQTVSLPIKQPPATIIPPNILPVESPKNGGDPYQEPIPEEKSSHSEVVEPKIKGNVVDLRNNLNNLF